MKSNCRRKREYRGEQFQQNEQKVKGNKEWKYVEKGIWRENWRSMRVTPGKCVRLQISADCSRTPNVTEQNTSVSNPWQRRRCYHLSTLTKGEHLSPLYLSPSLPEQYVAGRRRWQEEREGENILRKLDLLTLLFTHRHLLLRSVYQPLSLSSYLSSKATQRRLISACTNSSSSYDAGSFRVTSGQPLIWDVYVEIWKSHWYPFERPDVEFILAFIYSLERWKVCLNT